MAADSGIEALEPTTTSLACYFTNGAKTTWYWGLNNDNSFYKLNGSWYKTPYTKLEKFLVDGGSLEEIDRAAGNAQRYYQLGSWKLLAIFAANTSSGSNYPIVVGDTELYPKF